MAKPLQVSYLSQAMSVKPNNKGLNVTLPRQTLYDLVPGTRIELVQELSPEGF